MRGACTLIVSAASLWLLAASAYDAASPLQAVIRPGTIPLDTNGKEIQAHDAGMLQEGDTYYWYGCSKKINRGDWVSDGVNVYSSTDFQNWKLVGMVFNVSQIQNTPWGTWPPWRLERPKILKNAKTGYYVMIFHLDDILFGLTAVGFAKSRKIEGPFMWVGWKRPGGKRSYDMTAFVDDDGTGYLVNSVENQYVGIWGLSEDYLDIVGDSPCGTGPRGEGQAVFKSNVTSYHMLASHLTGWDPNPEQLFNYHGRNPCGEWKPAAIPPVTGPGSSTTWDSQSTYVFPLKYGDETLFIYMGDRWNYRGQGSLDRASYVWLPVLPVEGFDGNYLIIAHLEKDNKTLSPWVVADYIGKSVAAPPAKAWLHAELRQEESRWAETPTPSQGRASGTYAGPPLDGVMHRAAAEAGGQEEDDSMDEGPPVVLNADGSVASGGPDALVEGASGPAGAEGTGEDLDPALAAAGTPAPGLQRDMILS